MFDLDALTVVLPVVLLAFAFVLGVLGAGHLFRLIWMLSLFVFLGVLFWFGAQGGAPDGVADALDRVALVKLAGTYAGALFASILLFLVARMMFAKT